MMHLIFGVAGGIVLAFYAIAYIERQRERRIHARWMAALYPKPRELPVWPAVVFGAMGLGLLLFAAAYFGGIAIALSHGPS